MKLTIIKKKIKDRKSQFDMTTSSSKDMMAVILDLQNQVSRIYEIEIDNQLKNIESEQATQQLKYLSSFIPDKIIEQDKDSLRCVLLISRLVAKSELIIENLQKMKLK